MKYKVGDKVRIKSLEWYKSANKNENGYIEGCSGVFFHKKMASYCGIEATIKEMRRSLSKENITIFKLDIDEGGWTWYDWMFEENMDENETSDYDYEQLKEIAIELIRAKVKPDEIIFYAKEIYKELKKK